MACSERINEIFKKSRFIAKNTPMDTFAYDVYTSSETMYKNCEKWEKIAKSLAYAIENQEVYVETYDKIIGRTYYSNPKSSPVADNNYFDYLTRPRKRVFEEIEDYAEMNSFGLTGNTGVGHIAWDWNTILQIGTSGLKSRCREMMRRNTDKKSTEFYLGVIILLEAMENWNQKHVEKLIAMGMDEEAEICKKVPQRPAESFREAIQSFFMQYIVVMKENPYGGNSPGRLDYYLWPYLEKDLKKGICTLEDAKELIDELFMRIDERIYKMDKWVETIVVGGSNPNGTSAVNPLTYIMIQSSMDMDITHPAVYVRIPESPEPELVSICAEYLKNGSNRAQILNDKSIMNALVKNGVSCQDACNYYCGGCMEVGIQGKTCDYLFNGWHNITKLVELSVTGGLSLTDGRRADSLRVKGIVNYNTFEEFYSDFISEAGRILYMFFKAQDIYGEEAEISRPSFLISSMIDNCIKKGRNMHGGGCEYYDYGSSVIGLPNSADYLYAVKKAVYDDKICTSKELVDALKSNYEGYEELRRKLVSIPKYGQENPEADEFAKKFFVDISNIYSSYVNRFGGNGKLVILTFIWAPVAGKDIGATADGNFAKKPVAQGVTPQCSSMTNGITSAINSCTSIPFEIFAGGASTMWDIDSSWASTDVISALLVTFLEKGGQIFQGNTTDVQTLIKAKENPEEYNHLMVRVGGYSARFVNLDEDLQNDIINRIRHNR